MAPGADEGRDKLRKAAGRSTYPLIRRCPNGATHTTEGRISWDEYIVPRREPGELKHLSTPRKRKKIDFRSSGERNGIEPKLVQRDRLRPLLYWGSGTHTYICKCRAELKRLNIDEVVWKGEPETVKAR